MLAPLIKLVQLVELIWFLKRKREANGDVSPDRRREDNPVRTTDRPPRSDVLDDLPPS